jgi:hypothetical protein
MIGKVIKYVFENDASLNGLFSGRVFPVIGAQGSDHPFAIYEVINITTSSTKQSDSHIDEYDVRITCVCDKYSDAQGAVEYIRTAFVRMNNVVAGVNVKSCVFDGMRDLFSSDTRTFGSQVDLKFRVSRD